MTVVPATVFSPTFTRTVEVVGTKTSTREPNRINPKRAPYWAWSPGLL